MASTIVLSAFMQVVFEKTASLLVHQFKGMWGADVHKELTKLQGTVSTIQAVLEDAEEKQLKDKALRLWLAKLKDAAYDADDILDEFDWELLRQRADVTNWNKVRHFSSENCLLFRIRMGRTTKEMVKRLDDIAEERSKFHLSTNSGAQMVGKSRDRTETHSFVIESDIVGRGEDKRKIVEKLISLDSRDCVSVLPIVGMGGLGKTTLAQMVYNEQRVKDRFQMRMWVCVSDEFDVARLAKAIIESGTGRQCSGSSMDLLQCNLRETLSSKRYLLVLDDVWNEDAIKWEELRVLLPYGAQGSAVIVTTRSEIVSSIMGTLGAYKLAHMSEDDCWILFKERAFASGAEEHPDLVEIGKAIVKKFGGLPLSAKTVGSLMRLKKDKSEWFSVLESEIWDLPIGENDILPALRLSYSHLPSHLKQCFAYCAIFPKDHVLEKELLIQLWMANGFIPSGGKMELEVKGHEIFNELASRYFFQDIEEVEQGVSPYHTTRCKMHDLIHDLVRNIMGNECCILEDEQLEGRSQNGTTRHVSLGWDFSIKTIDEAICRSFKSMRTLFWSISPWPIPFGDLQHIWWKAKSLRVLVLPLLRLQELPVSIKTLKHLRYLDLSLASIQTLPEAITYLFHLQTLKLEQCSDLRELPKGMKNMRSLKHLYIGGCDRLTCMPRGMGELSCLRTLSMYVVGSVTGSGSIGELKDLNIGGELALRKLNNVKNAAGAKEARLFSKHNLQFLDLSWEELFDYELSVEDTEEVMECLQPHQNIKQLRIYGYVGIHFPNWMMRCPVHLPNLVKIDLYGCSKCEDLPPLGQLCFLQALRLEKMGAVKYMGGSHTAFYGNRGGNGSAVGIFPLLKELKLYEMDNLEEWLGMGVTETSAFFPRLIKLEIGYCPKLTTMPWLLSVQNLSIYSCPLLLPEKGFFQNLKYLEKFRMDNCDKLALLLEEEDVRGYSTSLRCLSIRNISSLIFSTPSLGLWINLTSLVELSIDSCNGLVSLPDEFMSGLSSLHSLWIHGCKNLAGSSSAPSMVGGARGLQLQYLTALEELHIGSCEKLACDPLEFPPCIRILALHGCPNRESLPEGLGCLTNLVRMKIFGLPRLVSLPQSLGCLTALENLEIDSCQNLASLPDGLVGLTALEGLEVRRCPKMTTLPDGLGRLTALANLKIELCQFASLPDGLGGLTALVNLCVRDCPNLTTLPDGLGHLTALAVLKIESCQFASLPDGLGGLTALVTLWVTDCPNLTTLPDGLGGLTALVTLWIRDCPNLTTLPERLEGLTQLRYMSIKDCPKLTTLPESLEQQLPSLRDLRVKGCPMLETKYGTPSRAGWHLVSRIPRRYIGTQGTSSSSTWRLLGNSLKSTLCGS